MHATHCTDTFAEAFCRQYGCTPEQFARQVLFRAFYPHALPIAFVLYLMNSRIIKEAISAVEEAAHATCGEEINRAMSNYRYHLKLNGISPGLVNCGVRLSGRRLLNLYRQVASPKFETAIIPKTFPAAQAAKP